MPFDKSPKKFGEDVAAGLVTVNRLMLKRYTPADIRKVIQGLEQVIQEVRTRPVAPGDHEGLKQKGMQGQRLQGAMMCVRAYVKENRLKI